MRRTHLIMLLLIVARPAAAQDPATAALPSGFSGELSVGAEYNSNLSVDEIDVSSDQSDYALRLGGALDYGRELSEQTEWSLGYSISQSLYEEFSQLDRQTHILSTGLDYEVGKGKMAANYYYVNSRLDGEDFLKQHRISPSVSGFLARDWFLRGAWVYSETELDNNTARDADTIAVEFDIYYFVRGLQTYWNLGYRYKDEEAAADRFTYQSNGFKARLVHRFNWLKQTCRMELAWRYEDRDFEGITPSIGEQRADDRHRLRAELQIPMGDILTAEFFFNYNDYESNFPNADYDQEIGGVEFTVAW
ncbi:MAG: surface lipoprotein assembly modifier [Pseudomonadota bacterium]